ncbi:hypothetical protein MGALJ_03170 [Mycobacterium gallinarum]|uniref:Uncharacterized protein n=1 Tax=Mycobacterium gallinarum TaxID=39689 RepID=A0A9W4B617_9MYCO|nr:hypothetical protein [Mycobacterium gallinarum]BBY90648.1 hypothetical protein MGALJ_03170 [Mycobacterium gallinarum]
MARDRVALHESIAFEKWEGYAKSIDRGRHVNFGDKYIMAPDFVMMSPQFNDGVPQSITDMFSGEVADAAAKYAPDGDVLTPEWRIWWKHMPDYHLVSPFECVAGEWGFSSCDTYAGTLADGTVLQLREWDYIWTNEDGHVTRWDWFVDPEPWDRMIGLIGLDPSGLTSQEYTVNFLREGGVES